MGIFPVLRNENRNLTRALQILVSVFLVLIVIAGFGVLTLSIRQIFSAERQQTVNAIGTSVSKAASRSLSLGDYVGLENSIRGTKLPDFICVIQVLNEEGIQIASTSSELANCASNQFLSAQRFPIQDGVSEAGSVVLKIDSSDLKRRFFNLFLMSAVAGVVLLITVLFVITQLIIRVIQPLKRSVEIASRQIEFNGDVIQNAPEEIRPLIEKIGTLYKGKAKLESDARVAKIAHQVAHDIRSPLTALLMVEHSMTGVDLDLRAVMKGAVRRIQGIIKDLQASNSQDAVSIAAGALNGGATSADASIEQNSHLLALLDSTVSEKTAEYKDFDVRIQLRADSAARDRHVALDPAILQRVVSNLVNNAVESYHDRSQARVQIDYLVQNNQCEIRIRDFGCGIPKDVMPRLFERGASFNKAGGTGLGLNFAREKIEAAGGSILIESEVGTGTRVTIRLPGYPPPNGFRYEERRIRDVDL